MRDYAVAIQSVGLDVEVRLNEVPIFRDLGGRRVMDENFVNDYMAQGDNVLALVVRSPAGLPAPPPEASGVAELLAVERGTNIPDGELLLQVSWPNEETPPPPRSFPQTATASGSVDAPDHRGWRDAQPLRLDDVTRGYVLRLVRELSNALDGRRLDVVIALLRTKVAERARAFAGDPAVRLGDLERNYGDLMRRPDWAMERWTDQDALLELVGRERLIRVTNADRKPLLRSVDLGGIRLAVPTDVSYVKGRWTILR